MHKQAEKQAEEEEDAKAQLKWRQGKRYNSRSSNNNSAYNSHNNNSNKYKMAAVQRKLVHKQFNSPMGLYSQENVKATLNRELKAFGADG